MRAVSNTSPISNLAIIGRLEILRARYGTVFIPEAVRDELSALTHSPAQERIRAAIMSGWIIVKPILLAGSIPFPLDPGESAAILLAQQERADILLIDERRGRQAARSFGIKVAGLLGELVYAKQIGLITAVKPEIERLRKEARFFIDSTVEQFILSEVGEFHAP